MFPASLSARGRRPFTAVITADVCCNRFVIKLDCARARSFDRFVQIKYKVDALRTWSN